VIDATGVIRKQPRRFSSCQSRSVSWWKLLCFLVRTGVKPFISNWARLQQSGTSAEWVNKPKCRDGRKPFKSSFNGVEASATGKAKVVGAASVCVT